MRCLSQLTVDLLHFSRPSQRRNCKSTGEGGQGRAGQSTGERDNQLEGNWIDGGIKTTIYNMYKMWCPLQRSLLSAAGPRRSPPPPPRLLLLFLLFVAATTAVLFAAIIAVVAIIAVAVVRSELQVVLSTHTRSVWDPIGGDGLAVGTWRTTFFFCAV